MIKAVYFLLHSASMASLLFIFSQAESIVSQPHALQLQNFNSIQEDGRTCAFVVIIKTSCSSIQFTRDEISLTFGDAYGNKVYAPRLDNPTSRRFERCLSDKFEITGPCTYQICHVSLFRKGSDGWKPESVTLYGFNSKPVTFYYKRFIPSGVWFGFNHCSKAS